VKYLLLLISISSCSTAPKEMHCVGVMASNMVMIQMCQEEKIQEKDFQRYIQIYHGYEKPAPL